MINGIFSMSEIAIISVKKARLMEKAKHGNKNAKTALDLANSPNQFFSTIQVGITTVGILMGAFSGSTISRQLSPFFQKFPSIAPYSESISFAIVVIIVSYFSLILGELVPKRIALNRAESIAQFIARPMKILSIIALPFVVFLTKSTDSILYVLGLHKTSDQAITHEEIIHAIDLGRIAGLVEPDEQKMVKRVLQFGDRQAHSIMTPRTNVIWLDFDSAVDKNINTILEKPFSRYPVIKEFPDNVLGIVNARDLLRFLKYPTEDLNSFIREPLFIAEHMTVLNVVELFRQHPLHFALVIDEYGGFRGIITPYDILQALVGELPLVKEEIVPGIKRSVQGNWYVDGAIPVQEFKIFFNIDSLPEEQRYGTLSGFVMHILGHIPTTGEHFDWNGFNFTIVSMIHNRIDEVIVHSPKIF
jgi:putative hemolysin